MLFQWAERVQGSVSKRLPKKSEASIKFKRVCPDRFTETFTNHVSASRIGHRLGAMINAEEEIGRTAFTFPSNLHLSQ